MFDNIGEGINQLFKFGLICFIAAVIFGAYSLYSWFKSTNIVKTHKPPTISWELKAKGHKIDTIWVYTFNK